MIAAVTRKGLVRAAASGLIGVTMLAGAFAQTKKLGDGLSSEGAGALFAGSNQTTNLDCAGGGAHIFGSNNNAHFNGRLRMARYGRLEQHNNCRPRQRR